MKRSLLLLVSAAVLGVLGALPAVALEPVKVLATSADESHPAASQEYLAWDGWIGSRSIVYAKPFDGARVRVSPAGYSGLVGAIDGTKLIYQRYSVQKGTSDLYLFDMVTKQQTRLPPPINTARYEYDPAMSGDIIVFARLFRDDSRRIYLWDASTASLRVIAATGGRRSPQIGQVNGDYLVYALLGYRLTSCEVFRYRISTGTTTRIPNPGPRCQRDPSVDPSGTVYFARSGFDCGRNVVLRAYPRGGPASTLTSIPESRDMSTSYAVDNGDGTTDVYFDPYRCYAGPGDIHKVTTPGVSPSSEDAST